MSRLQLIVYEYARGISIDLSNRAIRAAMSHGKHGALRLDLTADLDHDEAMAFYQLAGTPTVELNAGHEVIWTGRAEKIGVMSGQLRIGALGNWRALSDVRYTALWSDARYTDWEPVTSDGIATSISHQYSQDKKDERLFLSPKHGETIPSGSGGYFGYRIPDESSRGLVVVQFAYRVYGADFTAALQSRTSAWASPSSLWSLAGSASAQTGAKFITFTAADALTFEHLATTDVTITDTGSKLLKITKLRIATSTANMVSTTIASNITAGVASPTPASMVGIYVGQELVVTGSLSVGEIVTVTAITSTTFTATFALNHTATIAVKGIVVYGDEIVEDVLAAETALNGSLSSSAILIESPGVDMVDALYEDQSGLSVVEHIGDRGDSEGNAWETGVNDNVLYLRPLGDDALEWAVDARISLERDIELLANDVTAVHMDKTDRNQRTAVSVNDVAGESWGLKRQAHVDIRTTLPVEAEKLRDVYLAVHTQPPPRVDLDFDMIYSLKGSLADNWMLHAGDTLTARNAPPTMDIPPDNTASFRLTKVDYDPITDKPRVEVESQNMVNQWAGVNELKPVNGNRKPFTFSSAGPGPKGR